MMSFDLYKITSFGLLLEGPRKDTSYGHLHNIKWTKLPLINPKYPQKMSHVMKEACW